MGNLSTRLPNLMIVEEHVWANWRLAFLLFHPTTGEGLMTMEAIVIERSLARGTASTAQVQTARAAMPGILSWAKLHCG